MGLALMKPEFGYSSCSLNANVSLVATIHTWDWERKVWRMTNQRAGGRIGYDDPHKTRAYVGWTDGSRPVVLPVQRQHIVEQAYDE